MDTSRGKIAKNFAINACFDGKAVTLRNDLHFPVTVSSGGSAGAVRVVQFNQAAPAVLVRGLDHSAGLTLPGDLVRVTVGKGAADVRISGAQTRTMKRYAIADAVAHFIPVKGAGRYNAFSGMVVEVGTAVDHFVSCMSKQRSAVGRAACKVVYQRDVVFAVGRAVVHAAAKKAVAVILGGWSFAQSVSRQVDDLNFYLLHASRQFRINALPPTKPPTTPPTTGGDPDSGTGGDPGSGGDPPDPPTSPSPSITATRGGRYGCGNCFTLDVAVHNFPTGVYTYTCRDNSGPGGADVAFYSHAVAITDPNQSTWPGVFCWDNAPYTGYVVINGISSNGVYFG